MADSREDGPDPDRYRFVLELYSHDMNNLLQMSIGNLDLAMRRLDRLEDLRAKGRCRPDLNGEDNGSGEKMNSDCRELIASIRKNVMYAHMADMDAVNFMSNMNALFSIVNGENINSATVDALEVARECAEVVQESYVGLQVSVKVQDGSCPVRAGRLLFNVFLNLFTNSIKYADTDTVSIEVSVQRDGDRAIFRVEDHGPGILDIYKEGVFQRYQRIFDESSIHGQGLGLAMCRRIVESYGGEIHIEDRVSGDSTQGVAAVFTLPLEPESEG